MAASCCLLPWNRGRSAPIEHIARCSIASIAIIWTTHPWIALFATLPIPVARADFTPFMITQGAKGTKVKGLFTGS